MAVRRPQVSAGRPSGNRSSTIAKGRNQPIQMPWVRFSSSALATRPLGGSASASAQVPWAICRMMLAPAAVSQGPTQFDGS